MELTGARVLISAWLVALPLALCLWMLRRRLLPALLLGPMLGVAWIAAVASEGNTVTQSDVVVLFTACTLGNVFAIGPIAYIRWVRRVLREAEQRALAS